MAKAGIKIKFDVEISEEICHRLLDQNDVPSSRTRNIETPMIFGTGKLDSDSINFWIKKLSNIVANASQNEKKEEREQKSTEVSDVQKMFLDLNKMIKNLENNEMGIVEQYHEVIDKIITNNNGVLNDDLRRSIVSVIGLLDNNELIDSVFRFATDYKNEPFKKSRETKTTEEPPTIETKEESDQTDEVKPADLAPVIDEFVNIAKFSGADEQTATMLGNFCKMFVQPGMWQNSPSSMTNMEDKPKEEKTEDEILDEAIKDTTNNFSGPPYDN
jgi:biotin carboxyl carrier protein